MKKIIIQAIKFFGVSGIGWVMDMCIFTLLTSLSAPTVLSNICSSFVAITFVYCVSTKKLFTNKNENLNLKKKYICYLIYQIISISFFSLCIGFLAVQIEKYATINFILSYRKIIAKIIVTPFTMVLNFLFMRFLIEKV